MRREPTKFSDLERGDTLEWWQHGLERTFLVLSKTRLNEDTCELELFNLETGKLHLTRVDPKIEFIPGYIIHTPAGA